MKLSKQFLVLNALIISLIIFTVSCFDNPTGPNDDNGEDPDEYSHTDNPGLSANDFLSDENFTRLEIEIDYMEGFAPNEDAVTSLKAFLELRLNKTSVTISEPSQIPAAQQIVYTVEGIQNLENEYRDTFTQDSTLRAYILIVDGEKDDDNPLGEAYYNTSSVFFGGTFQQISGPGINQPSRFLTEAVSFRHEFGHLLGLVNIPNSGTEMQTEHQDTENGNHCDVNSCLMHYTRENATLFASFIEEEVPALGSFCVNDLQANGGK